MGHTCYNWEKLWETKIKSGQNIKQDVQYAISTEPFLAVSMKSSHWFIRRCSYTVQMDEHNQQTKGRNIHFKHLPFPQKEG